MASTSSTGLGGGLLLFLGFIVGAAVGIAVDEPSLGVLIGVGTGALLALLMWLVGRSRRLKQPSD